MLPHRPGTVYFWQAITAPSGKVHSWNICRGQHDILPSFLSTSISGVEIIPPERDLS
jgi:hypothetical protein